MELWKVVSLCGCALLLACSDDNGAADPDASGVLDLHPLEVAVDLSPADTQPDASATTTVRGKWTGIDGQTPISDMEVCLYRDGQKTAQCTRVDASGEWSLEVPMNIEAGLVFDAAGFEDGFMPIYLTMPTSYWKFSSWTDAEATAAYAKVNVSYPPTDKGNILVNGPGTAIAVVPPAGVGPYYGVKDFDTSLTQAPDANGWGEIMDLPPGMYDVDVTQATKTCTDAIGWPANPGHTLRLPVLAGHNTFCFVNCQ